MTESVSNVVVAVPPHTFCSINNSPTKHNVDPHKQATKYTNKIAAFCTNLQHKCLNKYEVTKYFKNNTFAILP